MRARRPPGTRALHGGLQPLRDRRRLIERCGAGLRERFASSAVARPATVRPDGAPHLVPVVFAAAGDTVWLAVDAKPKRTPQLQRLTNLRREPRCALLVDHYEDGWSLLWWVRADGVGVVVDEPGAGHPGLRALIERHLSKGPGSRQAPL